MIYSTEASPEVHNGIPDDTPANDNESEAGSSDGGSEDNLSGSDKDFAPNEDSEVEDSGADEPYGSDLETENYNDSEEADSGNETEALPKVSPPRTRSKTQRGQ